MKKNILKSSMITAGAVIISSLLSSCNTDVLSTDGPIQGEPEKANITVNISGTKTKATLIDPLNEEKINSLQVLVFRQDGTLDAYASSESSSVDINCTAGQRDVYAVVNAKPLTSVKTLSALQNTTSVLYFNALDSFQMIGSTKSELYTGINLEIPVQRIVSKIAIESITTDFTSDAYQNASFTVDAIYLVNAVADAKFGLYSPNSNMTHSPEVWYNMMQNQSDCPALLQETGIEETIANGASFELTHSFYCYPNPTTVDSQATDWCARQTRLVVEATLAGVKYYYPITIPEIKSNRTYTITNLTITRPGSSSADIPVTKAECNVTAVVSEWELGIAEAREI